MGKVRAMVVRARSPDKPQRILIRESDGIVTEHIIRSPEEIHVNDMISVREAKKIVEKYQGEQVFRKPFWLSFSKESKKFPAKICYNCSDGEKQGLKLAIGYHPKNKKIVRICFFCGSLYEDQNSTKPSNQGGNHHDEGGENKKE